MRIARTAITALTMAALLLGGGVSAFCTPASQGVMKCCKPVRPCGAGMKADDCCRFVPSAPGRTPAATESTVTAKISREELKAAALDEVSPEAPLSTLAAAEAVSPPLLFRNQPVPLYIMNTSLLR
jgi:hypothetical protein